MGLGQTLCPREAHQIMYGVCLRTGKNLLSNMYRLMYHVEMKSQEMAQVMMIGTWPVKV